MDEEKPGKKKVCHTKTKDKLNNKFIEHKRSTQAKRYEWKYLEKENEHGKNKQKTG